jgi:mono/diheme cytochrome c family protein
MHTLPTSLLVIAVITLSASLPAAALTPMQERGRELAHGLCAGCHAADKTGESPHVGAPRLREIDRYVDLDKFARRLREGILSTHHDMPMFRFSRQDAEAFVAYLRTLQGP